MVVNHLHLRDPLTDATVAAAEEAVQAVVDAGGLVAREVGGPWMREHMVPLLERDTERSVGEVIASAQA
jgi:hypothetical protein